MFLSTKGAEAEDAKTRSRTSASAFDLLRRVELIPSIQAYGIEHYRNVPYDLDTEQYGNETLAMSVSH